MTDQPAPPAASDPNWSRRVVVGVVLFGLLTLIALVGSCFPPTLVGTADR